MSQRVLIVGRHEILVDRVVAILSQHGFDTLPCLRDEDAVAALAKERFDVVFLGGVLPPAVRARLLEVAEGHRPAVPVVEHFGGYHSVLREVHKALGSASPVE